MNFNVLAFLLTVGCCLIAMIIAGKSSSSEDKEWFANLNHPDNSLLLKIMNVVGILFFSLFGFTLYRLLVIGDAIPITFTVLIILFMGLSPAVKNKTRNLRLFFHVMLMLPILVIGLLFFLLPKSFMLSIPVIIFALWLVYDLSYFYRLMKLNG